MSSKLFYYKREVKRKLKDQEVVDTFWDCFNLDCVVRCLWRDGNTFVVLLNDGHEQAQDVQKPIVKDGKVKGMETKRERDWFYSQIELTLEDAIRFMDVTDVEQKSRSIILAASRPKAPESQVITEGEEPVLA